MRDDYDVAVVGAGFSGLSSAILLAKLGLRVIVVESAAKAGGLLRSYVRHGLDCPVGVHYFGSAGADEILGQFLRVLEVRDALALRRFDPEGIIDRYVFDDFEFELPAHIDSLEAALRKRFRDDSPSVGFVIEALRAAIRGLRIDERGRVALTGLSGQLPTRSAESILVEKGCPQALRRIVSTQGFLTGADLNDVSFDIALVSLASVLQSAWELGCTGAEMAERLLERALARGAEVVTHDTVEAVHVEDGTARSLSLASGRTVRAAQFVSSIHPKNLLRRIPGDAISPEHASGVLQLPETPGVFGVVALVDAELHPARCYNIYQVGRVMKDGVYIQIRPCTIAGANRLVLLTRSPYENWLPWRATTTGQRGAAYLEQKRRIAFGLLRRVEPIIGPLDTARIIDIWTPLTLRDWTDAPEGGAYGVRHSPSEGIRYMVMTRTPIANLMQVGQSAIAPGLLGCTLSVIRAIGDLVGRPLFRQFLVDEIYGTRSAEAPLPFTKTTT